MRTDILITPLLTTERSNLQPALRPHNLQRSSPLNYTAVNVWVPTNVPPANSSTGEAAAAASTHTYLCHSPAPRSTMVGARDSPIFHSTVSRKPSLRICSVRMSLRMGWPFASSRGARTCRDSGASIYTRSTSPEMVRLSALISSTTASPAVLSSYLSPPRPKMKACATEPTCK
eukprot:scaffold227432_cov28-Tisochrysis_lutea.AAC.1